MQSTPALPSSHFSLQPELGDLPWNDQMRPTRVLQVGTSQGVPYVAIEYEGCDRVVYKQLGQFANEGEVCQEMIERWFKLKMKFRNLENDKHGNRGRDGEWLDEKYDMIEGEKKRGKTHFEKVNNELKARWAKNVNQIQDTRDFNDPYEFQSVFYYSKSRNVYSRLCGQVGSLIRHLGAEKVFWEGEWREGGIRWDVAFHNQLAKLSEDVRPIMDTGVELARFPAREFGSRPCVPQPFAPLELDQHDVPKETTENLVEINLDELVERFKPRIEEFLAFLKDGKTMEMINEDRRDLVERAQFEIENPPKSIGMDFILSGSQHVVAMTAHAFKSFDGRADYQVIKTAIWRCLGLVCATLRYQDPSFAHLQLLIEINRVTAHLLGYDHKVRDIWAQVAPLLSVMGASVYVGWRTFVVPHSDALVRLHTTKLSEISHWICQNTGCPDMLYYPHEIDEMDEFEAEDFIFALMCMAARSGERIYRKYKKEYGLSGPLFACVTKLYNAKPTLSFYEILCSISLPSHKYDKNKAHKPPGAYGEKVPEPKFDLALDREEDDTDEMLEFVASQPWAGMGRRAE